LYLASFTHTEKSTMAKSTGSSAQASEKRPNARAPVCVRADHRSKSGHPLDPSLKSWVDKIFVPAMVQQYIAGCRRVDEVSRSQDRRKSQQTGLDQIGCECGSPAEQIAARPLRVRECQLDAVQYPVTEIQ
jgi:hypothetical protein